MESIVKFSFRDVIYELKESKIPTDHILEDLKHQAQPIKLDNEKTPLDVDFAPVFHFLQEGQVALSNPLQTFKSLAFFDIDESNNYNSALLRETYLRSNISKYEIIFRFMRQVLELGNKSAIPSLKQIQTAGLQDDLKIRGKKHYKVLQVSPETFCDHILAQNMPCLRPYFGLQWFNEMDWNTFKLGRTQNPNFLFGPQARLIKASWSEIQERLAVFKRFTDLPHVFLAGGSLFSMLFGEPIKDIDLFIHGCAQKEAIKITFQCAKLYMDFINERLEEHEKHDIGCTRTANAVSFNPGVVSEKRCLLPMQVILRLYQTPSEVIHGFDVDACCIGYDGQSLWMTNRCVFALKAGFNTFSFDRLSPSYENRLAKYGVRGLPIFVPELDRGKIKDIELQTFYDGFKICGLVGAGGIGGIGGGGVDVDVDNETLNCKHRLEPRLNPKNQAWSLDDDGPGCIATLYRFRHEKRSKLHNMDLLLHYDHYWRSSSHAAEHDFDGDPLTDELREMRLKDDVKNFMFEMCSLVSDYNHPGEARVSDGFEVHAALSELTDTRYYGNSIFNKCKPYLEKIYQECHGEAMPSLPDYQGDLDVKVKAVEDLIKTMTDRLEKIKGMDKISSKDYEVRSLTVELGETRAIIAKYEYSGGLDFGQSPKYCNIFTNHFFKCQKIYHMSMYLQEWNHMTGVITTSSPKRIFDFDKDVYDAFACAREWNIPRKIAFKTINPGEQSTGTFHRKVLEDHTVYFQGRFYENNVALDIVD